MRLFYETIHYITVTALRVLIRSRVFGYVLFLATHAILFYLVILSACLVLILR